MSRRRRAQLFLLFGCAACALIFAPLLSHALGRLEENTLIAILVAALVGALALAELVCRSAPVRDLDAALRLDAISGERALFVTALDEAQLGPHPVVDLFDAQLERALAETATRDPLGRSDRRHLKLLALLLVLDVGLAAMPALDEKVEAGELGALRSYIVEAGADESLGDDQRRQLQELAKTQEKESFVRKLDEAWQEEAARQRRREALEARVEAALKDLEEGSHDPEDPRNAAATRSLAELLQELSPEKARDLAARLQALAREHEGAFGVQLDQLGDAAAGAAAGLGASSDAALPAAEKQFRSIMLALYDGLGSLPPSTRPGAGSPQLSDRPRSQEAVDLGGLPRSAIELSPSRRALVERYFELLP